MGSALRCRRHRKIFFASEKAALGRLKEILANPAPTGKVPQRAYKDEACGWWHLTAQPLKEPSRG